MGLALPLAVRLLFALQATQATIVGGVLDVKTREPVAGAIVALPDLGRSATTGADGRYALPLVAPGLQPITVRMIGYVPRTLHVLVPSNGEVEINVSLAPLSYTLPSIAVRSRVVVRGLADGDRGAWPDRGSSMADALDDPLLAEPDAFQALGGGEVVLKAESPSGLHVRGGASDQTAYLLDGVPVLSPYHAAGMFSAWNPDALFQLQLASTTPSPAYPDALSGTVAAHTRPPGEGLMTRGSIGTTQARLTVDGPLGVAGAGFLLSLRSGRPGVFGTRDPTSYLRAETDDRLAKLEAPALGGLIRLLGYDNENEISAASSARSANGTPADARRNLFAWRSHSLGAEWRRSFGNAEVALLGWSAVGEASSLWSAETGWLNMRASRRDYGILATVEHRSARASTLAGMRFNRSVTSYGIRSDPAAGGSWSLIARTPVASLFAHQAMPIGPRLDLMLGASVATTGDAFRLAPEAQLRWRSSERLTFSASLARRHQFAQSLRNPESVAGNVFPADLYIGVGAPGVPVARSDQAVFAAEYRPAAGVRVGVQAYQRAFDGLVLVAPRSGEPFATADFAIGSGASRGYSINAAVSTVRLGVSGSYGRQRTRLRYGQTSYVPDHGATHLFEGGMIAFPTPSFSVRLGATGALGRRTTPLSGGFEWEACNLLDAGCEFSGSPHQSAENPGATELPLYLRVDLGLRKTWRVATWGRDATVALFGTITNLFDRKNALTYTRDPSTGGLSAVAMRPLAPLVVGLDWRF